MILYDSTKKEHNIYILFQYDESKSRTWPGKPTESFSL